MGAIADAFNAAFRDYEVDGSSSSGIHNPVKADARGLGGIIEAALADVALQSPIGLHSLWIPAWWFQPQTTNGPPLVVTEGATNKTMDPTLDFDQSTNEFAQLDYAFPKSWNRSTIGYRVHWGAAAGTVGQNVIWSLEAKALSDNDVVDSSWGAAIDVTDTLLATGREHVSPDSAAVTVGGAPAIGDRVMFRIQRKAANAGDTLAADAKLRGIVIYYTTEAATDL